MPVNVVRGQVQIIVLERAGEGHTARCIFA